MARPARGPLVKQRATASRGLMSLDAMAAESNAKNASSLEIPHAVRISSDIAIVPVVGSVRDCAGGGLVVVTATGACADCATGGLSAAHAAASNRGASERATGERDRNEIGFIGV